MVRRLWSILNNHRQILLYLVFGGLTTAVNYVVYFPLFYWVQLSAALSNIIAWVAAVIFAFITNKPFVFKSNNWSAAVLLPELGKFISCRVFSGLLETVMLGITVDYLGWHGLSMKLIISVIVIVVNYVASKLFVFRNN